MKVGTMWPPFIWLFIATKAVSGVQYHVRLFTSDVPNAGTDAEIAVQIQGKVWTAVEGRIVKLRFPIDQRNSVTTGSGNVERVAYPPGWIKVYLNFASGQNKWHANRIALRKSGESEWIIFKVNAWVGAQGGDGRWRQPSHNEPYVAGVTWEVRVFTRDVEGAGTEDEVTLRIAGDTKHTRDLVMKGMSRGSIAKFYFDTVDVGSPSGITVMIPSSATWYGSKVAIKRIDRDEWINYWLHRWLGNGNSNSITVITKAATINSMTPCLENCESVPNQPVCGTDGDTYRTLCNLQLWACRTQADFVLKHEGGCTGVCPTDFLLYGEKCYQYVSEGHDWTQAFDHCQSLGGYLAEPKSASEYQYLKTLIKDNGVPNEVYIGGKLIDGEWTWVRTNDVIDYLPWSPPNPSGEGQCMSLWRARDYGLDDYVCWDSSTVSVCEAAPGPKKAASDASALQCQTLVTSALLGLIVAFM